jgi:hypothetical protein
MWANVWHRAILSHHVPASHITGVSQFIIWKQLLREVGRSTGMAYPHGSQVRVQVRDMATRTLTCYPHSGLTGEGIFHGVSIIPNCTVHPIIHQTLSKTIAALCLKYIQHNGLYQIVVIKTADEVERESSSIYKIKQSINCKAEKFEFKYLTCTSKEGKTGPTTVQ